jgi:rubrerythrin
MNLLEYALQTEIDGIEFYLAKAEENKENSLHKVFLMLAKDEQRHEGIIRKKMHNEHVDLPENETLASYDSLFSNTEELMVNMYSSSDQLDTYRLARGIEKKAIDLYNKLAGEADNPKEKEIFQYLLSQEKIHYDLFDELVVRVGRPEEWVESAEFGQREEY